MRTAGAAIVQFGIKELRSVWHDKVLLCFMIWAFTFGIYSAATAVSRELHHAPIAVVDLVKLTARKKWRTGVSPVLPIETHR